MPLGDSITAGYTDNPNWTVDFEFGYRRGLYTRLTNAGYDFTYVGGSPEPWVSPYGDPTRGGTYKPTFDLRDIGQMGWGQDGMGTDPLCVSRGAANTGNWLTVSILSVIPKTASAFWHRLCVPMLPVCPYAPSMLPLCSPKRL